MNNDILDKIKLAQQGDVDEQFDVGMAYFTGKEGVKQNYEEALKWFTLAAENNDDVAQFVIGHIYYFGKGVTIDYEEAVKYFELSASQGNAKAQNMLGLCYINGQGVQEDFNQAIKYFQLAADQNVVESQYYLGIIYFYGQGINQDTNKAIQLFKLAASNGDEDSQLILGELYYDGRGVEQSYVEASKYFASSAKQGNAKALYNLGVMFFEGLGVAKNHEECIKFMKMAKQRGMIEADKFLKTYFGTKFNNKWIELAVRKTLNILDGELTQNDFDKIKYLKIAEPYNNKYSLEISTKTPPCPFVDVNGGDEWEYCCVGKENFEKSLNIDPINISKEFGIFNYSTNQIKLNEAYVDDIKLFDESGRESTESTSNNSLVELADWAENVNALVDDLTKFKNLEVLRIQGIPFNMTDFLQEFKGLKVLEMADSGSPNLETLKELKNLQQLCIW